MKLKHEKVLVKKPSNIASWATMDRSRYKELVQRAKTENVRPNEFWLRDGESKMLRFADTDAYCAFSAYRLKTANGRFIWVTKPPPDKPDIVGTALGIRHSQRFVYRVVNIEGWKNKQGKWLKNVPQFFVVGARMYEIIRLAAKENEDQGALNEFNVKVSRSGSGTDTVYSFFPKARSPLTAEMKKAISAFPKVDDAYRPPSLLVQQQIVASQGGQVSSEEEESEESSGDRPF